jgi:hypothetical protein
LKISVSGKKVDFGAAFLGFTDDFHRRHFNAVDCLKQAVLHKALAELHGMHFAVAADRQAQHLGQRVDAGNAHAVQTAGHLVTVLVEFATGVQFGERDFGG